MWRTVRISLLMLVAAACSDGLTDPPIDTGSDPGNTTTFSGLVSDPVLEAAALSSHAAITPNVHVLNREAWIAAEPGRFPGATAINIQNTRLGALVGATITGGGFDPIAIEASAGDTLTATLKFADRSSIVSLAVVPDRKRPRVVRTSPARGQLDVAVNASIIVVFSEPMSQEVVDSGRIHLLTGTTPVSGTVTRVAGSPTAISFAPNSPLAGGSSYTLVIDADAADLSGDLIDGERILTFATGATTAPSPTLGARLEPSLTDLTLGVVPEGGSVALTITNRGTAISGRLQTWLETTIVGDPYLTLISDACDGTALDPGMSCDVTVQFVSPDAAWASSGALIIWAGSAPELVIPVQAKNFARLSFTADKPVPAELMVGMTSEPITLTVTNADAWESGTLRAVGVICVPSESPWDYGCGAFVESQQINLSADSCTGQTLNPGERCQVTIAIAPAVVGSFLQSLRFDFVSDVGFGQGYPVSLTATGLRADPFVYEFKGTSTGSTSSGSMAVVNTGDRPSGLITVALERGAASFMLTTGPNDCSGRSLDRGQSCSIWFEFGPTSVGPQSATVGVRADPGGATSVNLRGIGL